MKILIKASENDTIEYRGYGIRWSTDNGVYYIYKSGKYVSQAENEREARGIIDRKLEEDN